MLETYTASHAEASATRLRLRSRSTSRPSFATGACARARRGADTYEAADHWGDENPWGLPFFIVTHRPEEEPAGGAFTFVSGVDAAVERAVEAASGKDLNIMGGADIIRQALEARLVDELSIVIAPVVLGNGKRLSTDSQGRSTSSTSASAAVAARDVHRLPDQPTGISDRPHGGLPAALNYGRAT